MSSKLFKSQKQSKVVTIEECNSCGLKMKRLFQPNDFIFKEGSSCQKCGSKTIMTSIYKEEISS